VEGGGFYVVVSSKVAWDAWRQLFSLLTLPSYLCPPTFAMCWDEYRNHKTALAAERVLRNYRIRFSQNPNRIAWAATASEQAQRRQHLVVALPPLPPDPGQNTSTHNVSSSYPDHYTLLQRADLLVPYYFVIFESFFLLLPILVPLGILQKCLARVGLWPYIERPLRHLVLRSILLTARIALRSCQRSCGVAVGFGRECIRLALAISRHIISSVSLIIVLLLLPILHSPGTSHQIPGIVSAVLSLGSSPILCKGDLSTCLLEQPLNNLYNMAGFGRKIFYTILTVFIGVFLFLPLVTFAAITFGLSIWFLSFLIVYKGAGAIGHGLIHWWHGDPRNSPEAIARRERAAAYAKREARAHSESGSQSSASNNTARSRSRRSNSNVSLASLPIDPPQIDRDYEGMHSIPVSKSPTNILTLTGIGGWLIQRDNHGRNSNASTNNDNDSQASLPDNPREIDAPALVFRRRSFSASSTGINSPEVLSTPSLPRHASSTAMSGQSGSHQNYFINPAAVTSSTSISSRRNSRVARAEVFED